VHENNSQSAPFNVQQLFSLGLYAGARMPFTHGRCWLDVCTGWRRSWLYWARCNL